MTDGVSVADRVAGLIGPVVAELGFELIDVEFLAERGRRILRVYADSERGINLDECALVSREVGSLIDLEDLIPGNYVLEVSSPGLDRPLKKSDDFLRALGRRVKIQTAGPVEGRRKFTGTLERFDGDSVEVIVDDGGSFVLPAALIRKANLVYEL